MFWLKQIGENDRRFYQGRVFDQQVIRVDFGRGKRPVGVSMGDTLIVYGIQVQNILFAGSVASKPYRPEANELQQDRWRMQWYWAVDVNNLTPNFGVHWAEHNLNPHQLEDAFHQEHPGAPVTRDGNQKLGALKRGPGYIALSDPFGEYVLKRLVQLNQQE
jgi:hypothetical protein